MKSLSIFLKLLVCLLFTGKLAAQPVNDYFVNRTVLVGTNLTVAGDNSGASWETGENIGIGGDIYWLYSVWYQWTAPTDGILHLTGSTTVPDFELTIRAFQGTTLDSLREAPSTPDGAFPLLAGNNIVIQITSVYSSRLERGAAGPFKLNLWFQGPAPTSWNDDFSNRLAIVAPLYHFDGSILGATSELDEPLPPAKSKTLWWKFIAPEDGILAVWPSTPQFIPAVALYEGSLLKTLDPVAPINDFRYRLQGGHEYALQLAADDVKSGALALDVRFMPLTNDSFAGSTHVEGTNWTYVGNITTATFEPGEPSPGYTNTAWISWAAPFTGHARFNRTIVDWYQPVIVYTGPTLDLLKPVYVRGMDNNRYDFLATQGTIYHFQMSGGGDECVLSFQLFPWDTAPNDSFANASLTMSDYLNPNAGHEWLPVADATSELGEPAHLDGAPFKSLWWKWTAPAHGSAGFSSERSLATNVILAAYKGTSIEALTLLGKGTNTVHFDVTGGNSYYIAAAVPTDAVGDIIVNGGLSFQSSASRPVSGNLLREPSWEETFLVPKYWSQEPGVGGGVEEQGGADGTTWPTLGANFKIWQDIPTVPGRSHSIRFAMRASHDLVGSGIGDGRVRVLWDGEEIGIGILPASEFSFWHWPEFTAVAHNTTTRITFQNLGRNIELDAFSVVALDEPPQIITSPAPSSAIAGGTATFVVGASGSLPLTYQWFLNDKPFASLTSPILVIDPVSPGQAGNYQAVVSNPYGSVTSAPVILSVETPIKPVILSQPFGDAVGIGGPIRFAVTASGTPPLAYQWSKDGVDLAEATDRTLVFASVALTNAGAYTVRVQNPSGTVWSLNANLVVTSEISGGGTLNFGNRVYSYPQVDAPVFDLDGVTPLNGSTYVAQLYGGPSVELIRPLGQPAPFQSGFSAGYFYGKTTMLPTVPPGSNAVVQVRVWDNNKGGSYEEARALGGRFGKSELLSLIAGGGDTAPSLLVGLQRFSLQAGRPHFATGQISFVERQDDGVLVWSHLGEPGFRYLIEKSTHDLEWRPYLTITSPTGVSTFTDSADSNPAAVFYRSRILD